MFWSLRAPHLQEIPIPSVGCVHIFWNYTLYNAGCNTIILQSSLQYTWLVLTKFSYVFQERQFQDMNTLDSVEKYSLNHKGSQQ